MKFSLFDEETPSVIPGLTRDPEVTTTDAGFRLVGRNDNEPSITLNDNEAIQKSEKTGVGPLSKSPGGWLGLSWVYYDPKDPLVPHRVRPVFTILLIITAIAGGFGYHYRDLLANAVTNPRTTTNVPVTSLRNYTIRTLDDPANKVGLRKSLAIGKDGYPVISYYDNTAYALKLYKCNDATCSSGTARTLDDPANQVGSYNSLAIGTDGYPVIAYEGTNAPYALYIYKCNETDCSSGSIATYDVADRVGQHPSIAIGMDGYPVIAFQNWTMLDLMIYKCNDASCSSGTAYTLDDSANAVGYNTSLAIGTDGYPVIAYQDQSAFSLKLYKCNDASCSSGTAYTLDDSANAVGYYISLAIGRDGYPVISYNDSTAGALKFYKCSDVTCSTGTASTLEDTANALGSFTSIAIGRDGYPVISYTDTTAKDLKLLKCGNSSCTATSTMTIDSVGDVGNYTSMKIGNDGYPVISYYDIIAESLKFAYVGAQLQVAQTPEGLIDDGLVGHWTFDGQVTTATTTLDSSSTHATGTLTNGPKRVQGKLGQGLQFDGVDDYMSIANSNAINFDYNHDFAVSSWIKLPSTQNNAGLPDNMIIEWPGIYSYTIRILNQLTGNSGRLNVARYDGVNNPSILSSRLVNDDTWHFVLFGKNGSTLSLFVDGVLQGTTTDTTTGSTVNGGNLYLGIRAGSELPLTGTIDDVRIYNRALSADEIANLYSGTKGSRVGKCGDGPILDADGNKYGIVEIGTQCWLDRNMNVGTRINVAGNQTNNATIEKYCYNDTPSNCTDNHPKRPDGGLYQWDEAMQYSTTEGAQGICPAGWHIPTDAEWYTLENFLKDAGQTCNASRTGFDCSGATLRLKSGGSSLFEGNYAGVSFFGSFGFRDSTAKFWTSSESGANARNRGITTLSMTNRDTTTKTEFFSVRCIKD